MAQAVHYVEFLPDGHLSFPGETVKELNLTQGTKFELFSNQKDVIVLKKVESKHSVKPCCRSCKANIQ
ncbi:MAG: hypothetical protein QME81_03250 [bacterium]|nr:hypothetical protein [bacterium]